MTSADGSANAYDLVAYTSGVFPQSHPDHLATVARLHGLAPPPVGAARVLDIGGGDGMNLLAMAEALPDAEFVSFDIAEAPVARGRALAAAAGIGNVRITVADILDADRALPGPFDYVIAHGIYAWVPPPVQAATLALIGRVLAPGGVAYVSYNALPGGHLRRVLRDMMLHALQGIHDPQARYAAANRFLDDYTAPREDDRAAIAAIRDLAGHMAKKGMGALLHDELNPDFSVHSLTDVVAAGRAAGLAFLNQADHPQFDAGLPGDGMDEAAVVRAAQSGDHAALRFFNKTLFVRADATPRRSPDADAIRDLYVSGRLEHAGGGDFMTPLGGFTLADARLIAALAEVAMRWPARTRVGDLVDDTPRLLAIYRLFAGRAIELHSVPYAGAATPGLRPVASRLARALMARGDRRVFTLDHGAMDLDDQAARGLIALLDGSRDRAAIAAATAGTDFGPTGLGGALDRLASCALLLA